MSRPRHLSSQPLAVVRAGLLAAVTPSSEVEVVPVEDALGRVTGEAVAAASSVPHYNGAAMDGIAVRAEDTAGASEASPLELELGSPTAVARPFSWVDTGNALPAWADAVVMIERVFEPDDAAATGPAAALRPVADTSARRVRIVAAAAPWQHVCLVGEDVVASEPLLPRGHAIRAYDVGALLAAGVDRVAVRRPPVVAILPTGDELIEPGEPRRPGRVVEFNSRMIASFVREWGGEPRRLPPAGDNLDALASRIALAQREADVVCVIAGSSAGEHDFTARALAGLGKILAHGIDIMPGKPAVVAVLRPGEAPAALARPPARVALGIPGYPVSAAIVCRELLEPLLARLLGTTTRDRPSIRATVTRPLRSRSGIEELVRVAVGEVDGRFVVSPLARGAGAIATLVRADGIVRIPSALEAVSAGEEIEVELLRPVAEALGTILVGGSHDPVLALLEDALRRSSPQHKLATSSVGSAAGLAALARGEVHAAAVHVLGREPGAGADAVARLLGEQPALVVHVVEREVGLIVAAGNPLGLSDVSDLERPGVRRVPEVTRSAVRMVSRQPHAADAGPSAASAGGAGGHHAVEELTHMAVAAAVQSGLADAGLGIASAAAALGLGFVPVGREDYDLVLRPEFAASEPGGALRDAICSPEFAAAVAKLPGYGTSRTGQEKPLRAAPFARPRALQPVPRP